MDTKGTSGVCPSRMNRQDYARNKLNPTAPVYTYIEKHFPLCASCREDDAAFRNEGKEDAHGGFLGRLFRR